MNTNDRTLKGRPMADQEERADEVEHGTGQVLGQSVPVSRDVTQPDPGSPETGAVRDDEGRPTAEKPYT
jgi:hypothetical protein